MPSPMPSHESTIQFDLVIPSMIASNQKQCLRETAREIAKKIGISERILLERMTEKEKQSPSAIGDGISILQLSMSGLQNAMSVFVRLKHPCDMAAPDNKDVDLFCVLLSPEREGAAYLRTMARISRLLRDAQICSRVRSAADEKDIRNILEQSSVQRRAA